jgi:hypothetical protein
MLMFNARFYSLWAINDVLEIDCLRRQLDELKRLDFDGVVFHPRFYPNQPPYLSDEYLSIVSDTILHAKSIGLEFWIYDENGWPSGTVGGELPRRYPELVQQWMEMIRQTIPGGPQWKMVHRFGAGVDYLNPELARHFLQITYERYRTGLRAEAFEHVTTFFCDEPEFGLGHAYDQLSEFGAIPWTPKLPEIYRERYGGDIRDVLALLFFDGEGHREARISFWELLTDVFCDSFITPLNEWCCRHGKQFTAHVKGEEHPLFQVPMVGSCHQVFQKLALPGIDALERYPSGHFFPRQVASAAQQFGNGECVVECFGGAGWGASPEDLERYLRWLSGHGLTHFVLHLNQQRLTSHAIRDWPPSIPSHVNWRDAFPTLLRNARSVVTVCTPADTLLVAPYRAIMAEYEPRELRQTNIHNASTYPDSPASAINREFLALVDRFHQSGSAYHISDERTIEQHGRIDDGRLLIGRCAYDKLVIPAPAIFNVQTRRMLAQCNVIREPVSVEIVEHIEETPTSIRQIAWTPQSNAQNDLVLEAENSGPFQFAASFNAVQAMELQIEFFDLVDEVTLNGETIGAERPGRCIAGANVIRFTCHSGEPRPILILHGTFAVRTGTPYVSGPGRTIATNGPFTLESPGPVDPRDLIASGYPFCSNPIRLHGILKRPFPTTAIRLMDVRADCARIEVNDVDCGWCWGPDWTVQIATPLPARVHKISIHLTPSTFNRHGPHHHIDGDRPIISPAQYQYVRNFADRPDAPSNTWVSAWHFKPFGIGNSIGVRFLTAE